MQVIDNGHKYQLLDGQEIRFLKKEKDPVSGEFNTVWVGTTNEELLEVLIDRTINLNAKMHSAENDVAIFRMQQALTVFQARTAARTLQNVEATPEQHQSAQAIVEEAKRIVRDGSRRMIHLDTGDLSPKDAVEHLKGSGILEKLSAPESEALNNSFGAQSSMKSAEAKQRRILHVRMGPDDKEYTVEEMQSIIEMFQNAELDPVGAVVASRGGQFAALKAAVGGEEVPYSEPLFRYLTGGIDELTTQDIINLEGYFSKMTYDRAFPDGHPVKEGDRVDEAGGQEQGDEGMPVGDALDAVMSRRVPLDGEKVNITSSLIGAAFPFDDERNAKPE